MFVVNGVQRRFHGAVTIVSADNPASALLSGFKQSASAFRFCRHCMGTAEDVQSKVHTCMYIMYITQSHKAKPYFSNATLLFVCSLLKPTSDYVVLLAMHIIASL